MPEAPPALTLPRLREIVADPGELAKGTRIFDDGGLQHLARFEHKLFADARGSGASPYKVQILLDDPPRARCSCMAARSRPFCKHAAALLVAWARAPEGFAVSDAAPAGAASGDPKRKSVKTSKQDERTILQHGVEQVATLVRELGRSGITAIGRARAEEIAELAKTLRESRLRRLSARVITLSEIVATAASGSDAFDAVAFTELFTDVVLTTRKLEKHLGGEALEDVYVQELVGKTWTKKDRIPLAGLELVEYGFVARTTADDFVIRESRLFDLATGTHYSEMQILPQILARRTPPKPSHAGFRLSGASGSRYPSFAPHRIDLESPGERRRVVDERESVLEALLARCLPTVSAAITAFQEHRRDVFAPDTMPVAVHVETVLAERSRLRVVDAEHGALFLPGDPLLEPQLATVLRDTTLVALLGDVALDGVLPTLFPRAAIVRTRTGLALRTVITTDAERMLAGHGRERTIQRRAWAETAWAAGVSPAAIALGEVRIELADVLASGLGGLVPRRTAALVARLRDLGLGKPAELLAATAARPDADDRLNDFVKLYHVLGVALTRLTAAIKVDRTQLVDVPTFASVKVPAVGEPLDPRDAADRVGRGLLDRFTAAVHYAAYYRRIPADRLVSTTHPAWADGAAQPFVVRVCTERPTEAIAAAARAVEDRPGPGSRRPAARMTRLTAIRVLEAVGNPAALEVLDGIQTRSDDPWLVALARRASDEVRARAGESSSELDPAKAPQLEPWIERLSQSPQKTLRRSAALELAAGGFVEALPHLRAALVSDAEASVREGAAEALGRLGDVEAVDLLVRMVEGRHDDEEAAKLGVAALSTLGDVRGIATLLRALAEGWQLALVGEAIESIGVAALEPLCDLLERAPALIQRKTTRRVIESIAEDDVAEVLCERATVLVDDPAFVERATVLATLAALHERVLPRLARTILALRPHLGAKSASKQERALARKLGLPSHRAGSVA